MKSLLLGLLAFISVLGCSAWIEGRKLSSTNAALQARKLPDPRIPRYGLSYPPPKSQPKPRPTASSAPSGICTCPLIDPAFVPSTPNPVCQTKVPEDKRVMKHCAWNHETYQCELTEFTLDAVYDCAVAGDPFYCLQHLNPPANQCESRRPSMTWGQAPPGGCKQPEGAPEPPSPSPTGEPWETPSSTLEWEVACDQQNIHSEIFTPDCKVGAVPDPATIPKLDFVNYCPSVTNPVGKQSCNTKGCELTITCPNGYPEQKRIGICEFNVSGGSGSDPAAMTSPIAK